MCADASISVVVPAYEVEPWIRICLTSVVEQQPPVDEIVVVDDGSTDGSGAIAQSFPGVNLLRQENRGLSAARNTGAAASTSDWILFLDADDLLLPGAIAALLDAEQGFSGAEVIIPAFEASWADGRVMTPAVLPPRVYRRRDLRDVIFRNPFGANSLIRRETALRYPYDESLRACEDLDLWFRLLLDDQQLVWLGTPGIRLLRGRPGALTAQTLRMRQCRRALFRRLWHDPRTTPLEKLTLAYQLTRVSAGVALAAASQRTTRS